MLFKTIEDYDKTIAESDERIKDLDSRYKKSRARREKAEQNRVTAITNRLKDAGYPVTIEISNYIAAERRKPPISIGGWIRENRGLN